MTAARGPFGRSILARLAAAMAGFALPLHGPALAEELRFELPVDCEMGTLCTIQKYVDHDPGPGFKDHTCGHLANDNHDGIDFRVPTLREMEEGVPVIAAAPGVVKALRDGMKDISIRDPEARSVRGREAGNGVVVSHGDGWETQYSHLRRGSVAVEVGDRVETGDRLGLIGLSGNTEYPHVHFSVRRWDQTIDPFTGRPSGRGCGEIDESLWSDSAQSVLEYRAGGLLAAGFVTDKVPEIAEVRAGIDSPSRAAPDAPVIVFYGYVWGVLAGDKETIRITHSDGAVVTEKVETLPSSKADWFRYVGGKRPSGGWPLGTYTAEYRIEREERGRLREVIAVTRALEIR